MLLEGKTAVIYGAGGSIGRAVAASFAREGASVFLAGRSRSTLDQVVDAIQSEGGRAKSAAVDALDQAAVDRFASSVANEAGSIDISFNLISYGDVQKPLMELTPSEFLQPIQNAMQSHFTTTRAAARYMIEQRSGVILAFGGSGPHALPGLGGFKIALDAIEGHRRQWATELGPYGIRVITLKTGGVPETIPDDIPAKEAISESIREGSLLNRAASLADVCNTAVFAASDHAAAITGSDINISCGSILD